MIRPSKYRFALCGRGKEETFQKQNGSRVMGRTTAMARRVTPPSPGTVNLRESHWPHCEAFP